MDPALARTLVTLAWTALIFYWWIASKSASEAAQEEGRAARYLHMGLFVGAFSLALLPQLALGVPTPTAAALGLAIALSGIAFAIWARATLGAQWSGTITLKEHHELITRGPYAIVRHPIYTGLLVGFLGSALVIGDLRGWIALSLCGAAVAIKIPREERVMERAFGDVWRAYRKRVRAIVPFLV